MAIRSLIWEKGLELGIREKAEKLDDELVLKYLEENMQNPEQLILKCGRSYWDVTNCSELFDAGEEFTPEALTKIDYKQLTAVEPPTPVFKEEPEESKNTDEERMNLLFQKTEEDENEEEEFVRKTYYIRTKDAEALTILHHMTRVAVSALAREAFERGLTSIANEIGCDDLYERAEENLKKTKGFTGKKKSFKQLKN